MRSAAAHIAPADLSLLGTPLEFLRAEHRRQKSLCDVLDELANSPRLDVGKAESVVAYLKQDMFLHVIDEEEDLFPLLRRRCKPEDDIGTVLGELSGEHSDDERLAREIREALAGLAADGTAIPGNPSLQSKLALFAKRALRHLKIENEVVLPIASKRLTDLDKADFARRLAARRGTPLPAVDS